MDVFIFKFKGNLNNLGNFGFFRVKEKIVVRLLFEGCLNSYRDLFRWGKKRERIFL